MATLAEAIFKYPAAKRMLEQIEKNWNNIGNVADEYIKTISATVIQDIDRHFKQEMGPEGKWADWSPAYEQHMKAIGKGGNNILQDTGNLRKGIKESNFRKQSDGVLFFNDAKTKGNFAYAAHHDETAKKIRKFMYISDRAMNDVAERTLAFLIK